MKRIKALLIAAIALNAAAQNVQLHYDFGHTINSNLSNRPSVTTTVEMFKPDGLGSTFLFVDIDYQRDGVAGAYWEISREFNFTRDKHWAAHIEYNGGLSSDEDTWNATRFQHALLLGGAYNWHNASYSSTFSIQAMYKRYFKNRHWQLDGFNGFQLTGVWSTTFGRRGLCTFSGFIDVWYDKNVSGKLITLTEPQFWFNLNAIKGWEKVKLSIGTEVEMSNCFVYDRLGRNNRFYCIPTAAAKWTFN